MFWSKIPLDHQIDEYCSWKKLNSPTAASLDKEWLERFKRFSKRKTVEDITLNDIMRFREKVWSEGAKYPVLAASQAIRCFLRYFKARKYPCLSPLVIEKPF